MKSAILETVLSRRNIFRITDCHLLTSVPGEFDRFSEFTGDGSLKATFPEQGVYCLDLIPVLFLSNLRQVCGCTFDAFFIDEFNSNPMDPYLPVQVITGILKVSKEGDRAEKFRQLLSGQGGKSAVLKCTG